MQAARRRWRKAQPTWERARLVFIDETGLNTKMARLYGRAPRHERCVAAVPHGHWQTSTFIAALRHDGLGAPFLIEGAVNAEVFTAYLQEVLCPELKPDDIVILDNLSTHKIPRVAELIAGRGATVRYLPAYSPDLNPIEQLFARLKSFLRKMKARTVETLWRAISSFLKEVSKD